ncbi:hypothetical protein Tco_0822231 [Tanacetum coccineum]|uniref:Uncharacterized protein n=1 Tax=Tanacetum coccineum TaxID=301880 RepID=A0ABQ5AHK8_9ASTR
MRIVHRLIVGALVHSLGSKERCQKKELWMMSALEEARGINVAWFIAEYLCKSAPGIKENNAICGGLFVAKIVQSLGYYVDEETEKCSEPIECEKWTTKMLAKELDLDNQIMLQSTLLPPPPRRDSMLMRNNYMLEHCMLIFHHLADQANFAYPTNEPPNVPPYPYPYVPYPHPYKHYPDMGNQSHEGGHYEASGDGYFTGSMPNLRGTSIVPSSGYEVGGSLGEMQDEDVDDASMREKRIHTDDDMGSKED